MNKIAALILAAGCSSRLGRPKQLVPLGGESLVHRVARVALESRCDQVRVVVGAQGDAVGQELEGLEVKIVNNDRWSQGLGSSIREGIKSLDDEAQPFDAVLILLVDQPAVDAELLNTLIDAYRRGAPLVACEYADTLGVPALFARKYFEELAGLPDSKGAKAVLRRHGAELAGVAFPGGRFDIDTEEDLTRSLQWFSAAVGNDAESEQQPTGNR